MQKAEQKPIIEKLFCKFCGTHMALTRVEPSLTPDHDRITYECSQCGHSLVKEVKYR